jgi:hypothetical protein
MAEQTCPACGGSPVPVLYGLPDVLAVCAAERGEAVLGVPLMP